MRNTWNYNRTGLARSKRIGDTFQPRQTWKHWKAVESDTEKPNSSMTNSAMHSGLNQEGNYS
jgi:hypothetical protein